jgi:hypothetical protein
MLSDALNAVSCPASIAEGAPLVQGTEMRQTACAGRCILAQLVESQRVPRTGVGVAMPRQLELE